LGRITAKTGARTGNLPCPCPLQPTLMGRAASDSAKFPGWSLRPACRQTSASSIRENRVRVVHSVMRRRDGLVSKLLWSGYPKVDACPGIPGRRACGAAGYADARGTYPRRSTDKQEYSTENQGLVNGAYAATHGMVTVHTYSDEARSGLVIDHREVFGPRRETIGASIFPARK
jgi:hypothetical protein